MIQPWFSEAKLGIFVHYGIYAVKGIPESWSFFNGEISYEDYMSQCSGFTAAQYDPVAWAQLFKDAGACYAVLTTKHHDGVALWDTSVSDLSVVHKTPAARDLIAPYSSAMRDQGIKVGLYFSHLDWSHPDYPTVLHPPPHTPAKKDRNPFADPIDNEEPDRWQRFIAFHRAQLKELCTQFHPDLFWFDGNWGRSEQQWGMAELREQLHQWSPGVVLNGRMHGYGDYQTPEQGIPVTQPEGPCEFSMTVNDSWGYQHQDHNHKSLDEIVRVFCECLGMGGNLLLDIGPKEDGTFLASQVERLKGLGAWIRKHEEAVYSTNAGLPCGHFYGPTTFSRDKKTLYLYLFDIPRREVAVKGLASKVKSARVVGSGTDLTYRMSGGAPWANVPGVLYVNVPESALDCTVTVIALEFDDVPEIYHGPGQSIEKN